MENRSWASLTFKKGFCFLFKGPEDQWHLQSVNYVIYVHRKKIIVVNIAY